MSAAGLRTTSHSQRIPGPAPDVVILSADEAAELSDRVYRVRCAGEDVVTALDEGAETTELRHLCDALMRAVKAADGWR